MNEPKNRPRLPRPSGPGRPPPRKPRLTNLYRNIAMWALILLGVAMVFQSFNLRDGQPTEIAYSEFAAQLNAENIESVTIVEKEVTGKLRQSASTTNDKGNTEAYTEFRTMLPFEDPDLVRRLEGRGVSVEARRPGIEWGSVVLTFLPWILIIGIWVFLLRQMQGGGSRAFSFGKSRARLLSADAPKVTFDDVAGADEAKEELEEIIEFLRDPKKFQRLGGRIPKGVLLLGPPGTGKTLLARAVAGEAGVPFFSMSGSDFVEMFVGVGASRVRDLFEQGKAHAPCIIFIDEIDAVGRHRGAGLGGGHDEREQTLNQLLVEMDGFESNEGVILIAATNRPDVLDPALLRPGRFDRQVVVDRPDVRGREGIFKVHTRDIPLADDVDHRVLAKGTPGLSGADIENIVNEAALTAARNNRSHVTMVDFEAAKDKVMMGAERRSLVISDEEKRSIAYHEAGHALVRMKTPAADPVHKVTIIPRGRALGVTHFLPEDERHIYTRDWCENQLVALLGGRAAEVLVLKATTTGAGDDLQRATDLARRMVTKWGMSEALGPLTYGDEQEQVFLGREIAQHRDYSDETALMIDKEVKDIVVEAFDRAVSILEESEEQLHRLAEALLEREILDASEIERLLEGEDLARASEPEDESQGEAAIDTPSSTAPEDGERPPTVEVPDDVEKEEISSADEPRPAAAESARATRAQPDGRPDERPLPSDT